MRGKMTPERLAMRMTDDPDIMNESLFGFHVRPGNTYIDQFLRAIESNYIDWDITDKRFQLLFFKIFKAPSGVDDAMIADVLIKTLSSGSHNQNQALINKLVDLTKKQRWVALRQRYGRQGGNIAAKSGGFVWGGPMPKRGLVTLKNGAQFDCAVIIDGAQRGLNPNILWLGVKGKNPHPIVTRKKSQHPLPELYKFHSKVRKRPYMRWVMGPTGRYRKRSPSLYFKSYSRKPYHVVTVNKQNVKDILDYYEQLDPDVE